MGIDSYSSQCFSRTHYTGQFNTNRQQSVLSVFRIVTDENAVKMNYAPPEIPQKSDSSAAFYCFSDPLFISEASVVTLLQLLTRSLDSNQLDKLEEARTRPSI